MVNQGDIVKCIKVDIDLIIDKEYIVTKGSYMLTGGLCIEVNNSINGPYYEHYFIPVLKNQELEIEIW